MVQYWTDFVLLSLESGGPKYHRPTSMPQKPGTSALCHRLCPALVEQRRQLLELDSLQPLHEQYLQEQRQPQTSAAEEKDLLEMEAAAASSSNNDNEDHESSTTETSISEFVQTVRWQKPAALWSFPAVTQLVHNCQRRLDFENECRRWHHRVNPATNLVDVPERYVRLDDDDDQ